MADERHEQRDDRVTATAHGADDRDDAPLATGPTRSDGQRAQHVERVARLITRRLRSPGGELFSLLDAEHVNETTGWTYRYVTPSGNVVRGQAVSLPSDALLDAWRLAERLAREGVAA